MNVSPATSPMHAIPAVGTETSRAQPAGIPFSQVLSNMLVEANATHENVSQGVQQLILGETDNIQALAVSVAEADLAFRLVMEVRDKLISAYQEVMRMQV